jgi:hypothetical protein
MAARLSALCTGGFLPLGRFLVLISVTHLVEPRAIVRLEELGKLKKSTSSGTRTGKPPACNTVSQPIPIPRAPDFSKIVTIKLCFLLVIQLINFNLRAHSTAQKPITKQKQAKEQNKT